MHPHRKQDNSIGKTGQPDKSPQIEAIRGKPRIAIFLLITNSEASGTQKRKDGVMRSKHFLLLVVLFIAGTTNAAFAQHAHMGGFAHLRSLGGGLTGPATTSGFHPNIGFGSSSAGGSGGTPTGPTIPGSSGAVSGMQPRFRPSARLLRGTPCTNSRSAKSTRPRQASFARCRVGDKPGA